MKNNFLFILILLLTACSTDQSNKNSRNKNATLSPSIFNLTFIYGEGEKMISFPIWFNDSIVASNNITSIERVTYYESSNKNKNLTSEDLVPEKKIKYQFNTQGKIDYVQIGNYYDNRLISTIKIQYSKLDSTTGFASVKLNESLHTEEFPYHTFRLKETNPNVVVYEHIESKNCLFIVPHKEHWKPMIIDTLCSPKKEDVIIWGSLTHPTKIYSVHNLVEESNVRTFTYKKDLIQTIDWTDHPFSIHRTYQFNKQGDCTGFVDSTFSLKNYISATSYQFELKDRLPISVTKKRMNKEGSLIIFKETFNYIHK